MSSEPRPRWPGLSPQVPAAVEIAVERAIVGRVPGGGERWLRASPGLGPGTLGAAELDLGPVAEARTATHWRPALRGERLQVMRSYPSPVREADGRGHALERQVFAVEAGLPPAAVLLALAGRLAKVGPNDWWAERARTEWADPGFCLPFAPAELGPLVWSPAEGEAAALEAVGALREASKGRVAELAAALRALMADQAVVMPGLAEPWSAPALAGLLLLLPPSLGRRLVVQGWAFSPALSWPPQNQPRLLLCSRSPKDGLAGPSQGKEVVKAMDAALQGDTGAWWREVERYNAALALRRAPAPAPVAPTAPPVEALLDEALANPALRPTPPDALRTALADHRWSRALLRRLPEAAARFVVVARAQGIVGLEAVMDWVDHRLSWIPDLRWAERDATLGAILLGLVPERLHPPQRPPEAERVARLLTVFANAPLEARLAFLTAILDGDSAWKGHVAADPLVLLLTGGQPALNRFFRWATGEAPADPAEATWEAAAEGLIDTVAAAPPGEATVPLALLADGLARARHAPLARKRTALLRSFALVLGPQPGLVDLLSADAATAKDTGDAAQWGRFLVPLGEAGLRPLLTIGLPDIDRLRQRAGEGTGPAAQAILRLWHLAFPAADAPARPFLDELEVLDVPPASAGGWFAQVRPEDVRPPAHRAILFLREMATEVEEATGRLSDERLAMQVEAAALRRLQDLKHQDDKDVLRAVLRALERRLLAR